MSAQKDTKKKTAKSYKMVIYHAEDFSPVRSFFFTERKLYRYGIGLAIVLLLVCYLLFAFTPFKLLIPRSESLADRADFIALKNEMRDLERTIAAQETYITGLSNLLQGNEAGVDMPDHHEDHTHHHHEGHSISPQSEAQTQKRKTAPDLSPDRTIDQETSIYSTFVEHTIVDPVEGVVSADFSPEKRHFGIDILAAKNTPIKAIMPGYVFLSGWDLETGYSIGIQHANNVLSFYKHNSILLKEKGTFVKAGEAIAIIGNSGTVSNGPHLHFELWHDGKPINPRDFINFNQ